MVWNYQKGWFAYACENMVIIEELQKERKQKIITLPDQISVLALSANGERLVIGAAYPNKDKAANIYILDCVSFVISRTLVFHTKGVQQLVLAKEGKYLISIGNLRESTVAIWELESGKLLTSSYTLDKINDCRVTPFCYHQDRFFEFATVGKDQIQFWAFTREHKLEYYDVFVDKI